MSFLSIFQAAFGSAGGLSESSSRHYATSSISTLMVTYALRCALATPLFRSTDWPFTVEMLAGNQSKIEAAQRGREHQSTPRFRS